MASIARDDPSILPGDDPFPRDQTILSPVKHGKLSTAKVIIVRVFHTVRSWLRPPSMLTTSPLRLGV